MRYLPVFSIALEHHLVFWLADLACVIILDFLNIFLGLDPVIFRESAVVTLLGGD